MCFVGNRTDCLDLNPWNVVLILVYCCGVRKLEIGVVQQSEKIIVVMET